MRAEWDAFVSGTLAEKNRINDLVLVSRRPLVASSPTPLRGFQWCPVGEPEKYNGRNVSSTTVHPPHERCGATLHHSCRAGLSPTRRLATVMARTTTFSMMTRTRLGPWACRHIGVPVFPALSLSLACCGSWRSLVWGD